MMDVVYPASALLGVMVFFVAVVSPTVFASLDEDHAAGFLRKFFPRYFAFEALIGAIITLLLLLADKAFWPGSTIIGLALINMSLLTPRINDARDAWEAATDEADKRAKKRPFLILHAASVALFLINAGLAVYIVTSV
ncbi:MAG: hypothetical protein CML57_00675 [Rhodobacteraceae bacterium]|nr:hypothetical protein [Paracoccaceae bacterium]HCJ62324.1 hypothetical protein [Alphaproteobacteria bacterium]|tara:strand:- start:109 stop:522 length:414 start_codon:yes stop_codon:yes gene_type:complete